MEYVIGVMGYIICNHNLCKEGVEFDHINNHASRNTKDLLGGVGCVWRFHEKEQEK